MGRGVLAIFGLVQIVWHWCLLGLRSVFTVARWEARQVFIQVSNSILGQHKKISNFERLGHFDKIWLRTSVCNITYKKKRYTISVQPFGSYASTDRYTHTDTQRRSTLNSYLYRRRIITLIMPSTRCSRDISSMVIAASRYSFCSSSSLICLSRLQSLF